MKSSKKQMIRMALAATLLLGVGTAQGGTLQVPHSKQDRVIVYTYKTPFAHPVDYWWHLNPSSSGSWDYFSPVQTSSQPLPLEKGAVPTIGTPTPSVRAGIRKAFSNVVYGNPAVTGTTPAYQQANY
jgi:hypothetical protein